MGKKSCKIKNKEPRAQTFHKELQNTPFKIKNYVYKQENTHKKGYKGGHHPHLKKNLEMET